MVSIKKTNSQEQNKSKQIRKGVIRYITLHENKSKEAMAPFLVSPALSPLITTSFLPPFSFFSFFIPFTPTLEAFVPSQPNAAREMPKSTCTFISFISSNVFASMNMACTVFEPSFTVILISPSL